MLSHTKPGSRFNFLELDIFYQRITSPTFADEVSAHVRRPLKSHAYCDMRLQVERTYVGV